MSLTSDVKDWTPIWERVHELPVDQQRRISVIYGRLQKDWANNERYNHELLGEAIRASEVSPMAGAAEGYEEAMRGVELIGEG